MYKDLNSSETTCAECKNQIDIEVCWCGSLEDNHGFSDGHYFIPLGCACGRSKVGGKLNG